MNRRELLRRWSRQALNFIYPPRCVFCQCHLEEQPEDGGIPICRECAADLPRTGASAVQQGENFKECSSPLYYTPQLRGAFHRYKFFYRWHLSGYFSHWMWELMSREDLSRFDAVTWSPISRRRFWERGFDQSELLARDIARFSGLPLCPTLVKRHIPPQSRTASAEERHENVKDAYGILPRVDVVGKRFLLVDDIITTGSTLEEASRILKENGAAEVCCVTIARGKR